MKRRHVAHVVHRFDFGGLENGLVNLINRLPNLEHTVIALTEASDIRKRIVDPSVRVYALGKRPGNHPRTHFTLFKLLQRLGPDVMHTRNFGTLDCQVAAFAARVPHRIHSEHGWDIFDPEGTRAKYRISRRAISPLVHRFVVLSRELEDWLIDVVGIRTGKVLRICNGVDPHRFAKVSPRSSVQVIGSITRFSGIKDPLNTIRAFIALHQRHPNLRLLMVGDGELLPEARRILDDAGCTNAACFTGSVIDVSSYLSKMDVFVLGSKREGISNTVLEAMASGLPVVATAVGGNVELVKDGFTGFLVPPQQPVALSEAAERYVENPKLARAHGDAARVRIEGEFSLDRMVNRYDELYHERSTNAFG